MFCAAGHDVLRILSSKTETRPCNTGGPRSRARLRNGMRIASKNASIIDQIIESAFVPKIFHAGIVPEQLRNHLLYKQMVSYELFGIRVHANWRLGNAASRFGLGEVCS